MMLRCGAKVFTLMMLIALTSANNVQLPRRWLRQSRFFNPVKAVSDWFHGPSSSTSDPIANLGKYPVWKVHKYNGISIKPIHVVDVSALPQKSGNPPPVVNVPQPSAPPANTYDPPRNEYGPPSASFSGAQSSFNQNVQSGENGEDSSAALNALDSLGSLVNFLPNSEGGSSGGLDLAKLADLARQIPPEAIDKLQSVISIYQAKNNEERVNSLLSAAVAKTKLTSGAINSFTNFIQSLLGGAGGSKDIAVESGTYNNVPKEYPGNVGTLTNLPGISGPSSGVALPDLPPPPPLPEMPFLETFNREVKVPSLPHIYLPSKFTFTNKPGKGYVSFQFPTSQSNYSPPDLTNTYEAPKNTYEVPKNNEFVQNSPSAQPPVSFNQPQTAYPPLANSYGVPLQTSYSVPAQDNSFQASNNLFSQSEPSSYQRDAFNQEEFYPFQPGQNDIQSSPSNRHETVAFPQEQSPSYSQVAMQRGSQPANDILSQQASPDLSMYLDPNHPASTQNLSQDQFVDVSKQRPLRQDQDQQPTSDFQNESDVQSPLVSADHYPENNHSSKLSQHRFQPKNPRT